MSRSTGPPVTKRGLVNELMIYSMWLTGKGDSLRRRVSDAFLIIPHKAAEDVTLTSLEIFVFSLIAYNNPGQLLCMNISFLLHFKLSNRIELVYSILFYSSQDSTQRAGSLE